MSFIRDLKTLIVPINLETKPRFVKDYERIQNDNTIVLSKVTFGNTNKYFLFGDQKDFIENVTSPMTNDFDEQHLRNIVDKNFIALNDFSYHEQQLPNFITVNNYIDIFKKDVDPFVNAKWQTNDNLELLHLYNVCNEIEMSVNYILPKFPTLALQNNNINITDVVKARNRAYFKRKISLRKESLCDKQLVMLFSKASKKNMKFTTIREHQAISRIDKIQNINSEGSLEFSKCVASTKLRVDRSKKISLLHEISQTRSIEVSHGIVDHFMKPMWQTQQVYFKNCAHVPNKLRDTIYWFVTIKNIELCVSMRREIANRFNSTKLLKDNKITFPTESDRYFEDLSALLNNQQEERIPTVGKILHNQLVNDGITLNIECEMTNIYRSDFVYIASLLTRYYAKMLELRDEIVLDYCEDCENHFNDVEIKYLKTLKVNIEDPIHTETRLNSDDTIDPDEDHMPLDWIFFDNVEQMNSQTRKYLTALGVVEKARKRKKINHYNDESMKNKIIKSDVPTTDMTTESVTAPDTETINENNFTQTPILCDDATYTSEDDEYDEYDINYKIFLFYFITVLANYCLKR